MNLYRHWSIALAMASLLAACGGGSDPEPAPPEVPTPVVFATISGTVRDTDGLPVSGVRAAAGDQSADTDADGRYSLSLEATTPAPVVVSFTKAGLATQTRLAADPLTNASNGPLDAIVVPVGSSTAFDPAATATLAVAGTSARVTLPAASLVRSDGGPITGPATAELTVLDASAISGVMPGNYLAVDGNDTQPIESYGALQVELRDADGTELNLAEGQSATLRIPAASRGGAALPASIPLFYFDESTGLWVQDGSATLQGTAPDQYYEGSVGHFSVWNADIVTETVYVDGCIEDSNGARMGAVALALGEGVDYIGSSAALTDGNGDFRLPVKKNATTRIHARSGISLEYGETVDVTAGDTDVALADCLVVDQEGAAPVIVFPPTPAPTTPTPPVGSYAGIYNGSFGGAETGTFEVVIDTAGVVTGSGHSTTFDADFAVAGTVEAGGTVSLNATAGTAGISVFQGSINAETGAVTGTWRYTSSPQTSVDGTFSGTRD